MFRFLTIIAIIYGSVYPCLVSGQNLEWTFQYVTDYSNYGITADNSGEYIYEAGTLRSMLSMETGDTINFNGAAVGFYINKFNSKGDLIWTRTYNTRSKFHPYNVGIKGNEIWLTGLDQGVLYINDTPINHTIYHNLIPVKNVRPLKMELSTLSQHISDQHRSKLGRYESDYNE